MPVAEGVLTVRDVWRLALPEGTRLLGGGEGLGARWNGRPACARPIPSLAPCAKGTSPWRGSPPARGGPHHHPETPRGAAPQGRPALVVDSPWRATAPWPTGSHCPSCASPRGGPPRRRSATSCAPWWTVRAPRRAGGQAHQRLRDAFERSGCRAWSTTWPGRRAPGRPARRERPGGGLRRAAAPGGAVETYPVRAAAPPRRVDLNRATRDAGGAPGPAGGEVAAMGLIDSLARLETEERLGADLVEQVLEGALSENPWPHACGGWATDPSPPGTSWWPSPARARGPGAPRCSPPTCAGRPSARGPRRPSRRTPGGRTCSWRCRARSPTAAGAAGSVRRRAGRGQTRPRRPADPLGRLPGYLGRSSRPVRRRPWGDGSRDVPAALL